MTSKFLAPTKAHAQYRPTNPVSTSFPSSLDRALSDVLETCLQKNNSPSNVLSTRPELESTLTSLANVINEWADGVFKCQGLGPMTVNNLPRLFSFGSHFMGVGRPNSDFDLVLLTPSPISSAHVFGPKAPDQIDSVSLVDKLRTNPHANDIVALPDAYVPIVNVNFNGLMVDLVWAPLKLTTFPTPLDIFSERFMEYVHEDGVRGLMGIRSDHAILRLVPNVDNFRTTLRAVKLWAEHRGIYSGMLGYLNGAACAVLTARICQMYPNSSPSLLLSKFFSDYAQWNWGTAGAPPVKLADDARVFVKSPSQHPLPAEGDVDKNVKGSMIILTPGFEPQNTMRIASSSTVSVIKAELARAKKLADYISGYAPLPYGGALLAASVKKFDWGGLFEKVSVTDVATTFVHVHIAGSNSSTSEAWRARVASRLRQLIGKLEFNSQGNVEFRPMPCCHQGGLGRVQGGVSYLIGVTYKSSKPAEGVSVEWREHLAKASSSWVTETMAWDRRSADQVVTVAVVNNANLPALV